MSKIKIRILEKPDKNWDKRVMENNGDIYQTTMYTKFQEKCLGMESEYLLALKDSKIVGQLVVTYGPRFAKYLNKRKRWFDFFSKSFKIYTFIRGPIIIDKKVKKEIYRCILDYLDKNKHGCFMAQDISFPIEEEESIYKLFYKKGFYSDSWGTVIIDTTKSEEDLFSSISRNQRRQIKKMAKLNFIVKEVKTEKDFRKTIKMVNNLEERNKIYITPKEHYILLFNNLTKVGLMKTFYLEKNRKGLATISLYLYGNNALRALVAHTDYSLKEKIPVMPFVEWHAIKWAKENGYKSYDFTGIRPESNNPKNRGIMEYKKRWGGEEIHYPYFSKSYSKIKSLLIKVLIFFKK